MHCSLSTGSTFDLLYLDQNASPSTSAAYLRFNGKDTAGHPSAYYLQPRGTQLLALWTRDRVSELAGFARDVANDTWNQGDHGTAATDFVEKDKTAHFPANGLPEAILSGTAYCYAKSDWTGFMWNSYQRLQATATATSFWGLTYTGTVNIPLKVDSLITVSSQISDSHYAWLSVLASFGETGQTPGLTSPTTVVSGTIGTKVAVVSWAPVAILQPGKTYDLLTKVTAALGQDANGTLVQVRDAKDL